MNPLICLDLGLAGILWLVSRRFFSVAAPFIFVVPYLAIGSLTAGFTAASARMPVFLAWAWSAAIFSRIVVRFVPKSVFGGIGFYATAVEEIMETVPGAVVRACRQSTGCKISGGLRSVMVRLWYEIENSESGNIAGKGGRDC